MQDTKNSEYKSALNYHSQGKRGKIEISPTKQLVTQHDLSLAYSPGVAAPCLEIAKDINNLYKYTAYGNLVAVISNGTAILGLGNLGAAASKPVMEGKAVLFKKFADIDSIDIEIDTKSPEEFINAVKNLGYSFAGINLEDIKAPECFIIEEKLQELMHIPVFHDDQHGTAIITAAGLINAAYLQNRTFEDLKIVVNGAGAASIACVDLLVSMGVKKSNVIMCDTNGVIYEGRTEGMNKWKQAYATNAKVRTLSDAIKGADVFLGLSVEGALSKEMVASMAQNPIIFAMANPNPEITPEDVKSVRSDAIIATGRSDYNNQINNVMGFPYIFRGALDVQATVINKEMKIAASNALAMLARQPVPYEVYKAYPDRKMVFSKEYIIPVPFDPRLITTIPIAVAKAAIKTGVARIKDLSEKEYKAKLEHRLNPSSNYMNRLFDMAHNKQKKIILAEGEEEEIIKAAMIIRDENIGLPILIGRSDKINATLKNMNVDCDLDGIEIMNASINNNLKLYTDNLYNKLQRKGFLYRDCARFIKTNRNIFAASMVACGDGDALITGVNKNYKDNLEEILKVIGNKKDLDILSYSIMINDEHQLFISDNAINHCPSSEELAKIAIQMADIARSMGYQPKVAMLSYSNFGTSDTSDVKRVREAINILNTMNVDFEYDGEMSAETALNPYMHQVYPFCKLSGPANILIMPDLNSALISTQLLQKLSKGTFIGPILSGFEYPVQLVQMSSSANQIVKMAAFAIIDSLND